MTTPRVSIVSTVYDRVDCLHRCLRSVQHLAYPDVEQIVVSDAPPEAVQVAIERVCAEFGVKHINLSERHNDWGMTPAWEGVTHARGDYVCFLSDDNAYLPDHLGPLVTRLDGDPGLAFAYSSCLYDGRFTLKAPVPQAGRIDLGQPLFRRRVLLEVFPDGFPFHEFAWDWRVIAAVMRDRRYCHLDAATFVFRFLRYPQLVRTLA